MITEYDRLPSGSLLDKQMVANAYFWDSYATAVRNENLDIIGAFEAIFGHQPPLLKAALIVRNWLARLAGLKAPSTSEIARFERKADYLVGDTIGPWPIFVLTENELIAGRDNSHLDFRLSILRVHAPAEFLVVSTVCKTHNLSGKLYLYFVEPFHRWGVKRLIANAVSSGRI